MVLATDVMRQLRIRLPARIPEGLGWRANGRKEVLPHALVGSSEGKRGHGTKGTCFIMLLRDFGTLDDVLIVHLMKKTIYIDETRFSDEV